ncbi:murein biosynthesis integral membrane protein MurJ [Permianibacter sp. IMCC34836]|uniref:murein biosynthesis integral membrane protein MurJ n=1 Tax=Permianibacter fluminis TaxID=2738515 RepID=UPI001557F4E0|nr:murein biosynthesis integral membrane protein MurJ [Permianibacter fluminis]NQD37687.1 murein biosynthesis integral membrane protein MurJ [Permianibacter fluminis]
MAGHLLRSGSIVSAMTLISRVLGLAREVVVANLMGAGMAADLFFVAQKIPNFLRRLFAEGAFSQAFIPVLSEYETKRSRADVLMLLNKVSGTLGLILLALTVVVVVAAPAVMTVYAPGFRNEPGKFELATTLLRITFPYLLFISLTAFAGSVLNSIGKFAVPAITPVFLSICQIIAALAVAPGLEAQSMALAWSIFVAGLVQLAFNLPFLWKEGLLPRPQWGWKDEGVQRILKLMVPAMFAVSVTQTSLLLDVVFVSFLQEKSVSWLYYADRLLEFPLGIFGIAIATVVLPSLSRQHAAEDAADFNKTMDWGLRLLVFIGLPATLGLILLSDGLVTTIYQRGAFTPADVYQVRWALIAYSIGLLSFMSVKVLATGFFARQNSRTPVRIAIISVVFNMICNAILIWPFEFVGLALATTVSSSLNAFLLYRGLRRSGGYQPQPGWARWWLKVLLACAVMSALLLALHPGTERWLASGSLARIGWLVMLVTVGGAGYLLTLLGLGVRLRHLKGHA